MIDSIRFSEQTKRKLVSIKRHTGVEHWNTLCRWAFCISVRDKRLIEFDHHGDSSNIEMTWRTFAGTNHTAYEALLRGVISRHENHNDNHTSVNLLRAHVDRGLSKMQHAVQINGVQSLLGLLK